MASEDRPCAEAALDALDDEIAAGQIEVYRGVLDVPYIVFNDRKPPERYHLYDRRVKAVLTYRAWKGDHGLLKHHEVERVVRALAGRAIRSDRCRIHDPEILALIEAEPVLAVVVEYVEVNKITRQEYTMTKLWKELHTFAQERGLTSVGRKRFPAGANVLSRKLSQYKAVLEQLGITVTKRRSNGCRVVIEVRQDDTAVKPSNQPSKGNHNGDKDLPKADDTEARLAKLQQRRANNT